MQVYRKGKVDGGVFRPLRHQVQQVASTVDPADAAERRARRARRHGPYLPDQNAFRDAHLTNVTGTRPQKAKTICI